MTDAAAPQLQDIVASYGPVEVQPLSRIQALTAKAMAHNWTQIPHVTHSDRIDVTELEAARARLNAAGNGGARLSPLAFLLKAVAATLLRLPRFNAVLNEAGTALILRRYVNLGLAIDTPNGLVVGVMRDAPAKGVAELGAAAGALAEKARGKGLSLTEMSGGGFTVSSLGAAGGTGFTPIINAPEVAILGVSRLLDEPRRGPAGELVWRKALPVSLSYDHRAINGAQAGEFMQALQEEIDRIAGAG